MELRDFMVTPLVLFVVYAIAYWVRPKVTDNTTRKYFIPALTVRVVGALAVGFIYQFYYGGGDTFIYHTRGSAVIWEAFTDNPINGLKLIFAGHNRIPELHEYTSQIWFYGNMPSYFVIRVAAFFDLLTFRSYSATAVLFASLSFSGLWALYLVFYKRFNHIHFPLACAILFVPSVFFWGSGILKDTITIAALGWATYAFDKVIFKKELIILNVLLFVVSAYVIFSIKKYILLCLLPALVIWWYLEVFDAIRSLILRLMVRPFVVVLVGLLSYLVVLKVGEDDPRYALENVSETARITAYDIAFWTGRNAGSTYTLGELDGTFQSMIRLFPSAVNVSLFRPYLWEVKNPFMLIAASESFIILILSICVVYKTRFVGLFSKKTDSIALFSLLFSITFAFAVGVSTYNFGTLMRYKIPLMPFYLSSLMILLYSKSERKLSELDRTE